MTRRFWLYALILALVIANGYVFYKIAGLYFADTLPVEAVNSPEPEPETQRQKITTKEEQAASVTVPILMYHYIRDYTDPNDPLGIQLSVSPLVLRKQLQKLKDSGYETISLVDLAAGNVKKKSIVLTFDDGTSDHYVSALPILKELNMTATFFIVKGFIGRGGYMTAAEITELKDAGMEIGGHSLTHKNLATQTYEVTYKEIRDSLRSTDNVFSYPSGKYSTTTVEILKELGVKATVTTNLGLATDKSDFGLLPRIRVKQYTDIQKVINEQVYLLEHPEVKPTDPSLPASQAN